MRKNFCGFKLSRILHLRHDLNDYNSNFTKDKPGKVGSSHSYNRSCRNYLPPVYLLTAKSCDQ